MQEDSLKVSFAISRNYLLSVKVGGGLLLLSLMFEKALLIYAAFLDDRK